MFSQREPQAELRQQRHGIALWCRLLCRMWGGFLGTTSATPAQTQGGHRDQHQERREGLAEAAGLAQLCGFQRYLIDSFFLTLPHSPNPHMHFSC